MLELNKIHLGDCYELIKQIPDKSVDCVYTDVPYLSDVSGGKTSENEFGDRFAKKREALKDNNICNGFNYILLNECIRVMKRINMFIWCSRLQIIEILNFMRDYDISYEILTWNKTNPQPGTKNTWLSDIEYCLYFREKGVRLNDGYELKSKWYLGAINKRDKDLYEHPTIKPLALVKRHIKHVTQPKDIILDPFMGSGTTAVAAIETGRQFIGFEIDPKWHKIACDRVKGITAAGQYSLFGEIDSMQVTMFDGGKPQDS